jgi:hypothetical protein
MCFWKVRVGYACIRRRNVQGSASSRFIFLQYGSTATNRSELVGGPSVTGDFRRPLVWYPLSKGAHYFNFFSEFECSLANA